jgi:ABC-type antimicrobial peptide transport system permease subunit
MVAPRKLLREKFDQALPRGSSLWVDVLRNLVHRRSAIVGMAILTVLVLVAIFAPVIATHDPEQVLIGIEDVMPAGESAAPAGG